MIGKVTASYECNKIRHPGCLPHDEFNSKQPDATETSNKVEKINHPRHYNKGKIEVIDFIEDQGLDFVIGNVVKYVCRHDGKDGLQDLNKAKWYLERAINNYKEDK